jgi:hypothetical protein
MTVTLSPAVQADAELREQIHSLTQFLQHEAGPVARAAHASWDIRPGEPDMIEFQLRDDATMRRAYFRRDDLRDKTRRELRALQAVSYFLEQHSQRNMERLSVLIGRIAAEEEVANGKR